MLDQIREQSHKKMQICVQTFQSHVNTIRTGRASPDLLNSIYVEYFGVKTPLRKVANIIVEDFHTLKINVFDDSMTNIIKKSLLNSKLDLNPILHGKDIRVPLPALTEERRKKLIKLVRGDAENSRIVIRNIRRDANDKIKKCLKNKIISIDQERSVQNAIQTITDKFIQELEIIVLKKEKELMQL
ncbi:ribosome recycling factor [Buchnera aphidicola]|uniref:ribosome recycling factor n=1 Tax=Buchnera aphidicola TaxID=9 RepID=UPI003463E67F